MPSTEFTIYIETDELYQQLAVVVNQIIIYYQPARKGNEALAQAKS